MNIIYKILFEVRFLHEYYLTKEDGTTIFQENDPVKRESFLHDVLMTGDQNISDDLLFSIPTFQVARFQNYHLKLLPTFYGFKVAVEVNVVNDPVTPGRKAFKPVFDLPEGFGIPVFVYRRNTNIDSCSNGRMQRALNTAYYFSNAKTLDDKIFPSLANPIKQLDNTYNYEQGELAISGINLQAFYYDVNNNAKWAVTTNSNFANETDRILITSSFYYSFSILDNLLEATFTITDFKGNTVFTKDIKSSSLLQRVAIDIEENNPNNDTVRKVPGDITDASVIYTLTVTGTGYNKTFQLVFLDIADSVEMPWSLINIAPNLPGDSYSAIDSNGLLLTRLNADGSVAVAAPVYEVDIKSRFVFWRYSNDEGKTLKNIYPAFMNIESGALVSSEPEYLSYTPIPVQNKYLPNPLPFEILNYQNKRLFADIMVSESDKFPLGP